MKKSDFIHVRSPDGLKEKLQKEADRQMRPLSNLVIRILSQYVDDNVHIIGKTSD